MRAARQSVVMAASRHMLWRAKRGLRQAGWPGPLAALMLGPLAAAGFASAEVGPDAPGAMPARAAELRQEADREAERMGAELKTLAFAVLSYVQDSDGRFPSVTSIDELRKVLAPYLGSHPVPEDRIRYVLPAGVHVGAIETPALTPMLTIDERPDFAMAAFADGYVYRVPKERFARPGTVGYLVLREDFKPAAGATITPLLGGAGGRTDETGILAETEVPCIEDEATCYIVSADGREDAVVAARADQPRTVVLRRRGGPADLVRLSGRVLDPAGRPVAGAELWMTGAAPSPWRRFLSRELGRTGADGRFAVSVPRLPVGSGGIPPYVGDIPGWTDPWIGQIIAHKPGYGVGWVQVDGDDGLGGLEIRLSQPASLRGQITDAEGRPVPGAPVRVSGLAPSGRAPAAGTLRFWRSESAPPWAGTHTDEQGRFVFTDLPSGGSVTLDIRARRPGASRREDEIPPDLGAIELTQPRRDVTVTLRRRPLVEGVLLASDGKPAAECKLKMAGLAAGEPEYPYLGRSATTDEKGHFEFQLERAGTWTIWAVTGDHFAVLLKGRRMDLGDQVTIPATTLQTGVRVSGRVLDAHTGAPVPGAAVTYDALSVWPAPTSETEESVRTGPDGSFGISGPPGKVVLSVKWPPYGYLVSYRVAQDAAGGVQRIVVVEDALKPSRRTLHVQPGEALTGLDLFVAPAATVTGEVRGPDGSRWRTGGVWWPDLVCGDVDRTRVTNSIPLSLGALLDGYGRFTMGGFLPGVPAVVTCVDEQYGLGAAARVTPELGAETHVTLRLSPMARLKGRVLLPNGSPAVGAAVSTGGGDTRTGVRGRFNARLGIVGLPTAVRVRMPPLSWPGGDPPEYEGESEQLEVQPGQQEVHVGDIVLKPYKPGPPSS